MRRKLVAGNWKMHGSLAGNSALLSSVCAGLPAASPCDVVVCVPALYLAQVQTLVRESGIAIGAQDVSAHEGGAYTGEIAAGMLLDLGCRYVIVGHSERRAYHAESDASVAQKAARALAAGLQPIFCVGETLAERDAGLSEVVVLRQLDALLAVLDAQQMDQLVLAYEPVWAIGTGKTATPAMAQTVHALLRQRLIAFGGAQAAQVRILYGGSMKPENAAELMAMPDIDGGLIGGAALKAADFLAIIGAAAVSTEVGKPDE